MPSISCIIVCYNNEQYIADAILSVLQQTRVVDEIIVADDGSTDASRDIISEYARTYSNIKPLFRKKNIGVAANRDLAIRESIGDYITTLDGDDLYSPGKIELEEIALKDKFNAIAYSNIELIDHDNRCQQVLNIEDFSLLSHVDRLTWLVKRLGPIPRDMLMSKKLYLEVGGFRHNLSLYEDWDLKIRLQLANIDWLATGETGVYYRRTGQGLSSAKRISHITSQIGIIWTNRQALRKSTGSVRQLEHLTHPLFDAIKSKTMRLLQ